MKQIMFYATKDDILSMLEIIESNGALKYVRMGQFPDDKLDTFNSGAALPNLGKANAESAIACDSYLVCDPGARINVRPLQATGSVPRVCIDQLVNPDTVTFTPGGIWNDEVVLYGRVATASESQTSGRLMKRFHSAIRKKFSKVKAFYVGAAAIALLEQGKRLTISAQSPRDFDLIVAQD